MKVDDLVILVGGRGKRINKITSKVPKPLIKIGSKPFLDQIISKVIKYNFKNIYLLCSYKKNFFIKKYNNKKIHNSKIVCIDEGQSKDTGGALYSLSNKIKKKFILINGDTFFDIDYSKLISFNLKKYLGLIALTESKKLINNKKITGIGLNKKKEIFFTNNRSKLANGGIYLFSPKIFRFVKNKKMSLENDILKKLIVTKKIKGIFFTKRLIDIGSYKQLNFLKKKINFIKNKAFFLDRDGVINNDCGYVLKFSQFKFLSDIKKAIHLLNKKNFLVIVITNQASIGKGLMSEIKLKKIHNKMKKEIYKYKSSSIDDIYYAPYYKFSKNKKYRLNKNDRKPNIGMFIKAINKWNIDVSKSHFIGDKNTDQAASLKAGIKFYYKKNISLYSQVRKII